MSSGRRDSPRGVMEIVSDSAKHPGCICDLIREAGEPGIRFKCNAPSVLRSVKTQRYELLSSLRESRQYWSTSQSWLESEPRPWNGSRAVGPASARAGLCSLFSSCAPILFLPSFLFSFISRFLLSDNVNRHIRQYRHVVRSRGTIRSALAGDGPTLFAAYCTRGR
jgi:hypothetical protein